MEYRQSKTGEPISILGYGCMRFTTKGGSIDIDKAEKEIENSTRKDSVHALSKDSVRVTYNYSGRTPLDVAIKNAKDQIASGKRNAVEKETRDAEVCFSH
jgi:predicted aldo/keto reductase-like oxidoreductase